jgi:hypothetical protein
MIYQRLYIDGKLKKTSKPKDIETARKWLDNMERLWSAHIMPDFVLEPGGFDPNNAKEIKRWSPDELIIVTTGNRSLRTINVNIE